MQPASAADGHDTAGAGIDRNDPSLALRDRLRSSSTVSRNYVSPGDTLQQMMEELRQATEQN
jgi:hypothetical protein